MTTTAREDATSSGDPGLLQFLALREVPWSLALAGFLIFFAVLTTYVVNLGTEAMVFALLGLAIGRARVRWPLPFWLLLAFWTWSAAATALSHFPGNENGVIELGKITLVFLVATNVLTRERSLRLFLLLFLVCFTLFPIRGTLFNYYLYQSADFGRPAWVKLFGNANDMAAMTILALAIAVGFAGRGCPRIVRLTALATCVLGPFVILLTQSRAAFLGLCAFLLLVLFSLQRGLRTRALIAMVAIGGIVLATAPADVWNRIAGLKYAASADTMALADPEGSAQQRWQIWETGIRIIKDNPGFGVGLGKYEYANERYSPELGPRDIHNTLLEVLAETGFPGLALFLALIISIVGLARRAKRKALSQGDLTASRKLQYLEYGMYGYLVAGLWGTYGFLSLFHIYLAALYGQATAILELPEPSAPAKVLT